MFSDKDTCCFCFPLSVGVIIIGCTVIMEFLGALTEKNGWTIFVTVALGIVFIITAIYRNSIVARRILAIAYVIAFVLEVLLTTLLIMHYFKTNLPKDYCKKMQMQGKLEDNTTINECALFVGQYFTVFVFMGIAYTIPFKLWFSYVLFKYSHQLIATEEGKKERAETVKEVQKQQMEMQDIGEPVEANNAN